MTPTRTNQTKKTVNMSCTSCAHIPARLLLQDPRTPSDAQYSRHLWATVRKSGSRHAHESMDAVSPAQPSNSASFALSGTRARQQRNGARRCGCPICYTLRRSRRGRLSDPRDQWPLLFGRRLGCFALYGTERKCRLRLQTPLANRYRVKEPGDKVASVGFGLRRFRGMNCFFVLQVCRRHANDTISGDTN